MSMLRGGEAPYEFDGSTSSFAFFSSYWFSLLFCCCTWLNTFLLGAETGYFSLSDLLEDESAELGALIATAGARFC